MDKSFSYLFASLFDAFCKIDKAYKAKANSVLADYTITEVHCIENIGKIDNPNVTKLANMMHITRGGISKVIKKIYKNGAIDVYKDANNKKEFYCKLTPMGKKIFDIHEKIHADWDKDDKEFLSQFSEKEIKICQRFLAEYKKHLEQNLQIMEGTINNGK